MERVENNEAEEIDYDATISMLWANVIAVIILASSFFIFVLPYNWLVTSAGAGQGSVSGLPGILLIIAVVVLSFPVHELLHAAAFILVGKVPVSTVKFGIMWKALAFYAHTSAPMSARAYRFSVVLPGLLLGVIPGIVGLVTLSGWLVYWGALMTAAAGGDLSVLLAVRSVPAHSRVLDHPSRAGCLVLKDVDNGN